MTPRSPRRGPVASARSTLAGGVEAGVVRAGVVAVVIIVALFVTAMPAGAHAQLEDTTPDDQAQLATPPQEVLFTFDEPVQAAPGALRVYDRDGARVDDGVQSQPLPDSVAVGLENLPDGGYVATYLVTSADGHVVRGAITFTVGMGSALDDATITSLFDASGGGLLAWLARALAVVTMGAALVAIGAMVVAAGRRSDDPATLAERGHAATIMTIAAKWGVPAAVAAIPVQAMVASGLGVTALTSVEVMEQVVTSSVGIANLTLVGGLLGAWGVAVTTRQRHLGQPVGHCLQVVGVGLVITLSLVLTGHTRTVEPGWVMMLGDFVHVVAAGVWLGGLMVVVAMFRRSGDDEVGAGDSGAATSGPVGLATVVSRFSGRALVAIAVVAVAGGVMTWALARHPRTLVSTDWGWALVVKLVLVGVLVVIAAFNRTRLVPLVTGTQQRSRTAARRQLGTTMRVEVVLAVVILAVTSVLTGLRPAAQEAGITGAFDRVVAVEGAELSVNVVVDPNRAGTNQVHLYLLDATRRPTSEVDSVTVEMTQTAEDLGPIVRSPDAVGPGHWIVTGNELAIPGPWQITVVVGVDQFTEHRVDVDVVVNPA